jgi:hypothetical protein
VQLHLLPRLFDRRDDGRLQRGADVYVLLLQPGRVRDVLSGSDRLYLERVNQYVHWNDRGLLVDHQQYVVWLSVRLQLDVFILHGDAHALLVLHQLDNVRCGPELLLVERHHELHRDSHGLLCYCGSDDLQHAIWLLRVDRPRHDLHRNADRLRLAEPHCLHPPAGLSTGQQLKARERARQPTKLPRSRQWQRHSHSTTRTGAYPRSLKDRGGRAWPYLQRKVLDGRVDV